MDGWTDRLAHNSCQIHAKNAFFVVLYGDIKCICVLHFAGKVVEEWILVDISSELYHINYKPSDCSHPKVVVDRARSRLNECK